MMFLLCPETTYNRDHVFDIDQLKDVDLENLVARENRQEQNVSNNNADLEKSGIGASAVYAGSIRPKKTYLQSLAIVSGTYSNDNLIKLVVAPFITLLNPGALYTIVASGILVAWYVGSSIVLAGIFSGPPWFLDAAGVGYLSAGPFIGGSIGSLIIAVTSDPVVKWATKRNKGI